MSISSLFRRLLCQRSGHVLVSALIASGVVTGMGVIVLNRATAHVKQMQHSAEVDQSWYLAMAGIEACIAKLRWDGTSWNDLVLDKKVTSISCGGSLAGGSYSGTATLVSGTSTMARITANGQYGRYSKSLVAIVQWLYQDTEEDLYGAANLYGGGNWRFGGNAKIEGNIASTGSITLGGGAVVFGNVYAGENITLQGSAAIIGGQAYPYTSIVVDYYDPIDTFEKEYTGNLTCPSATCDMNYASIKVNGILTISPKGSQTYEFPQKTTIMADGYVINGNMKAAAGQMVKLYSMSSYGAVPPAAPGEPEPDPCPPSQGSPSAGDVGSKLVTWVSQNTIRDVLFWVPNGRVYFKGSQSGDAGVYGRIYAMCVETSDNWNFYPGADAPEAKAGATPDPNSALTIVALYEP